MKMQEAADGVVVIEPVALGGECAEAGRAFESFDAGNQAPAVALVAAYDRSRGAQPAVVQ